MQVTEEASEHCRFVGEGFEEFQELSHFMKCDSSSVGKWQGETN